MQAYVTLIAISLLVILSYFFNILAKRIRVPSVLLLLGTGIIVQYGFAYAIEKGWVELELSALTTPMVLTTLGQVGIIMIVLEGALDLQLTKEKRALVTNAFLAALLILIASSLSIAFIIQFFQEDASFLQGLAYAVPLSVMSSAIVIPSVGGLNATRRDFMVYESTISDILGIMFFNFLAIYVAEETAGDAAFRIGADFFVTLLLSALFAYLLVYAFNKITTELKLFLIIAVLTLLYSIGKLFHYSSLLIIFLFGLILNNIPVFFRWRLAGLIQPEAAQPIIRDFHTITIETAFLVRTLFFFIFGLSIKVEVLMDLDVILIGSLITAVMYLIRLVNLVAFHKTSIFPELFLSPRGLVTILLFYTIPDALILDGLGEGIMFYVILLTGLVMTFGLIFQRSKTPVYTDLELGANPTSEYPNPYAGTIILDFDLEKETND